MSQSRTKLFIVLFFGVLISTQQWGFFGHKKINRSAVYSLPEDMIGFYKKHIDYITESAVNADKRRYSVKGEAAHHYIDLDHWGSLEFVKDSLPLTWTKAVAKYNEDSLKEYGTAPWHVQLLYYSLENAFKNKNSLKVLNISADLGHYISDCHVPLHTTENYNGQLTNQHGIHALWESRLPELFAGEYELICGKAKYIKNIPQTIWEVIYESHSALDSVLLFEKGLSDTLTKYATDIRNGRQIETVDFDYCSKYHSKLNSMVERRMHKSIKLVADIWYTAWINGGQPNMDEWEINSDSLNIVTFEPTISNHRNHEH
jgi:hypothetical protein